MIMTHLRSAVGSLPWLERGIYCAHTRRRSGPAGPVLRHGHPAVHTDTVSHITRIPVPSSEIYRGGFGFNGGSGQLWLPQHSAEAGSTASLGPAGLTCRPGHSVARASSHGQPRIPGPGPGQRAGDARAGITHSAANCYPSSTTIPAHAGTSRPAAITIQPKGRGLAPPAVLTWHPAMVHPTGRSHVTRPAEYMT